MEDSIWSRIRNCVAATFASVLAACAASPAQFQSTKYSMSDTRACNTLSSAQSGTNYAFAREVSAEVSRRGLNDARCKQLINEQRALIAGAVLVTTAVAVAAHNSGGAGGGSPSSDFQWDWDMFYQGGKQVARCRGVQTGQFAEDWHCNGKAVNDNHWPGQ